MTGNRSEEKIIKITQAFYAAKNSAKARAERYIYISGVFKYVAAASFCRSMPSSWTRTLKGRKR